jgi:hemolysin activation/secretion protein
MGYAVNNPLEGETKQKSAIASAGMGLRWTQQKSFSLRWDFGQVVDEGGSRQRGSRKTQFSVYYAF